MIKPKKWRTRSFALFVVVTVTGLWVLQTGMIYVLNSLADHIPAYIWHLFGSFERTGKNCATKSIGYRSYIYLELPLV